MAKNNLDDYFAQHEKLVDAKASLNAPEGDVLQRIADLLKDKAFVSTINKLIVLAELLPADSLVRPNLKNGVLTIAGCESITANRLGELNK